MASNPELEQAILANVDDPEPYLVLADWLQAHGDPRGELIVLQHTGKTEEANALIARHAAHLLGDFAERKPKTFELEWARGFITGARLGWQPFQGYSPAPRKPGDPTEADHAHAQLAAFLKLPSARFLQRLRLGPVPGVDGMSFDGSARVIEELAPPCLRALRLGDTRPWDISSTLTRMPASTSIRGLRELVLRGGEVMLPDIELPELTSFTVETGGLQEDSLATIAAARWPKLVKLEIWFGDPEYGASGGVEDIARILAGEGLPALRHLGLRNCAFADDAARALASSNILRQLTSLDLSKGNLSDRGIDAMVAARAAFAHLDHLDLDDNALTDVSRPKVEGLAKQVEFGSEHTPERAEEGAYRYVSVGE